MAAEYGTMRAIHTGMVWMAALMLPQMSSGQRVAAAAPDPVAMVSQRVTVHADNAPLSVVLHTIAQRAGLTPLYRTEIIPSQVRVTVHAESTTVAEAFAQVLRGTGLIAHVQSTGSVLIERDIAARTGSIMGHITNATSKAPLAHVKIGLDGTDRVESGSDGMYRLAGVEAGSHTLTVKLLGYGRVSRTIMMTDGGSMIVDIALDASTTTLDQVVVTGTVVQTELKAVPNAITVITAKQIEQRGITKIDQLFRGDVPGLFAQNQGSASRLDEVTMFSRGATALSGYSVGTSLGTNPIKTYVDGVEMADPKYLSQIDPKSIERIEILTGPQASTIYGSNAINGVMQIFTKRGTTSMPQLTLSLMSGLVENNFSNARTPQHNYSAQLSGLEGYLSYNAGGSWDYMGAWTPAKQLARTGGFGGVRLNLSTPAGGVSVDVTLRRTLTQNVQHGDLQQTMTGYREAGWYTSVSTSGLVSPSTYTLNGQTLGLTLSYTPTSWWSHELGLGSDASDVEQRYTAPGHLDISDTTLLLQQSHTDRRSLRYATTARIPIASLAQLTVTAGADAWANLTSTIQVEPQTLTGNLAASSGFFSDYRQPGHNTGGFLQTQLAFQERLFFTYGLRAEWNPDYGEEAEPNYAPRYGVAYTQEIGALTAKLRGSYGRSTRPPAPGLKIMQTIADAYGVYWSSSSSSFLPYYGGLFAQALANPDLAPEHQQGGEGGLELYLGTRGSLVITRYNQTVDGLITQAVVDSVRTLVPCATFNPTCTATSLDAQGYGYFTQVQNLNIGSIRNQGWELQGSVNVGPITTRGTYSWTKSRTIGVNPKYRAQFANQPQYTPGATFQWLPEHTWALGMAYARGSSSVALNLTGTGRVPTYGNGFFWQSLNRSIRLPQNKLNVSNPFAYYVYSSFNVPYVLADLTASHRFLSQVEGVLQVQNLTDRYINDFDARYASLGRQSKAGFRVRM